jgi:hypothetical protein
MFDLMDILVHGEDDRHAANQQDKNTEENESVDGNGVVVKERRPWADCTKPHEYCQVEKHVDGGLKRVIHCFEAEPVAAIVSFSVSRFLWIDLLLGKHIACNEACQEVISADKTAGTHDE